MEEKFVFEFNFATILTLLKGCRELPYKESANVIQYISTEYEKQVKAKEAEEAKDTPPSEK